MMEAYKTKDQDFIAKVQKACEDLYAPMREAMKKSKSTWRTSSRPSRRRSCKEAGGPRPTISMRRWSSWAGSAVRWRS